MANHFDDTDTLPLPPTLETGRWRHDNVKSEADDMQRDRFRLGRELARDFEDMATSTAPLTQPNGDYIDTLGTFDIDGDANAASTRNIPLAVPKKYRDDYNPGDSMLHHSPSTLDVEGMQAQFADFSMAADHRADDSDSYEVGRGHRDTRVDSLLNNTTDFFSMNPVSVSPERGRSEGLSDQSAIGGTAKSNSRSRKHHAPAYGSPLQKSRVPSLDFSISTTPRRNANHKQSSSNRKTDQPSKIMDVVSSSGSAGSASKARVSSRNRDSEEDALSELDGQQKRSRMSIPRNLRKSSLTTTTKNRSIEDEKLNSAARQRKGKAVPSVPRAFKSTSDFLKELGVDGHTHTFNLQHKLGELKSTAPRLPQNTGSTRTRPVEASSFAIPKLPDMTDLFSANDVTRFSTKQGAATSSHVPIDSIPIPHDSRALLAAMKLLEQKVDRLENARASNQQTCKRLEDELRQAESRHQVKQRHYRQQVADTTFNISEDGDAQERAHEKANIEWRMEKLKMETHIESLRHNIDQVSQQLEEARHCLRVFQEDHDAAISSVAAALAAQEDLKIANQTLERQLAQSELDRQQAEHAASKQRQEYEAMELRLRRRAKDAREAAAAAEEAMLDAARRELEAKEAANKLQSTNLRDSPMSHGQRDIAVDEEVDGDFRQRQSRVDFDGRVRDELLRIRPDLFRHRTSPLKPAQRSQKQVTDVEGRKRYIAIPKGRRMHKALAADSVPGERSNSPTLRHEAGSDRTSGPDDAAKLTLSPDEVRKLRNDIHAERHGRKTVERPSATSEPLVTKDTSNASAPRHDGRRIVKVVYLLDDDTEAIKLQNEFGRGHTHPSVQSTNAIQESGTQPMASDLQEQPPSPQRNVAQPSVPSVRFAECADVTEESNHYTDTGTTPKHDLVHEDHNPEQCTVCSRYNRLRRQQQLQDDDNPIAGIDASVIMPAPVLNPGSRKTADSESSTDGNCTARPSADPQLQLQRVVKQLQDEFRHLKLVYQDKSDAFARLDPSVGWRRRKALTNELNELVAEMGAKADQIYALYDVKEEIEGSRARGFVCAESEGTEDLLHMLGNRC